MSDETRINDALKHLGEEHRLGMVRVEEFRRRRRELLESWGDLGSITLPGTNLGQSTTQTNPGSQRSAEDAPEPKSKGAPWPGLILVAAALIGVASWFMLRPAKNPDPTGAPSAPTVQRSPELLAVMREATTFRNENRWDAAETDAFLQRWRSLPANDRRVAQQEPSLRSLMYELEQNIAAERQALEFSPSAEGQARLDRLQNFAQELTETGS